ncbi:MAG: T9SS type A sorting domain-containing protein [Saprospiraceae bacterium]|nr:T9SS type A sorting domain-containing protein [Saprospiraceae bacterium]
MKLQIAHRILFVIGSLMTLGTQGIGQRLCPLDTVPPVILNCPSNQLAVVVPSGECSVVVDWTPPTVAIDDCPGLQALSFPDFFSLHKDLDPSAGDDGQVTFHGTDSMTIVGTTNGTPGISNSFQVCFYMACTGQVNFDWRAIMSNGDGFAGDRARLSVEHQVHGVNINTILTPGNGSYADGSVVALQIQAGDRICFEVGSDNQQGVNSLTIHNFSFIADPIEVVQIYGVSPGQELARGLYNILYSATDCAGNESTCNFVITFAQGYDTIFTDCPDDITVFLDEQGYCDTTLTDLIPIANNSCGTVYGFNRENSILDKFSFEAAESGDGIVGTDGYINVSDDRDSLVMVGINNGTMGNQRNDTSVQRACALYFCPGTITFDWSARAAYTLDNFRRDEAGISINGVDSILSIPLNAYYASGTVTEHFEGLTHFCYFVRSTNMGYEDTLTITNLSFTPDLPDVVQFKGEDISQPLEPGVYDVGFSAVNCYGHQDTCEFQITVIKNGHLACKNLNVSLNENCEALITPAMLVSGVCTKTLEVDLSYYGTPVPNPVTQDYLWKHLVATVRDTLTGNSCWADVIIEDKLAPEIICHADTVDCNLVEEKFPLNYNGRDCSDYTVTTTGERFEHYECNELFLKGIFRDIRITDSRGNIDECTDTIYVRRIPYTDIFLPEESVTLYCDRPFELDENGHPSPLVTGYPFHFQSDGSLNGIWPLTELLDCHLFISYEDLDLGEISCVRKIMRTWTVREWWCNQEFTRSIPQLIIIRDVTGPVITHMPYGFDATTGNRDCHARVLLPPIEAVDACHNDLRVDVVFPGGILIDQNGGWADLPVGEDTVYYRVYDGCYNLTEVYIIVHVRDETEPVAVCDRNTVVAITHNGYSWVPADVFDDGSFDECALHHFEVRRMDADFCGTFGEDDWGAEVGFCCEDVGKTIMVGFKAIDHHGNEAICMVNVEVQDKDRPLISCPPDITIDCRFDIDYEHLEVFGKVVMEQGLREPIVIDPRYWHQIGGHPQDGLAEDNCPPVVIEDPDYGGVNQCGIGTIYRYFWAVDQQGNESERCYQRIVVINHHDFGYDDIDWPRDTVLSGICDPRELIPERLPPGYDKPVANDDECSLIGLSYHDDVFSPTVPGDPCFKIIRVWKVIDWCQRDIEGNILIWEDTQYIKIINEVDPQILRITPDTVVCSYDVNCRPIPVSFSIEADDDCTDPAQMLYIVKIDLNSDGTIDFTQSRIGGREVSGTWPLGRHLVKWEVEDRCGNTAKEHFTLELLNCKPPVAYCLNGLSTNLTPMDLDGDGVPEVAMDSVWAKDFDAGSYHNCGYRVKLSFSEDTNDIYRVYDCDDRGLQEVEMWVTDENGNTSFCRTFIDIQDNSGFCPPNIKNARIEGEVKTEVEDRVENVRVELQQSGRNEVVTNNEGKYSFDQLAAGSNYVLYPRKTDGWINGVTTADIVKIQRHILGLEPLSSAYKMIAADVNRSGTITSKDVSDLRRLILGVTQEINGNTSWRFIHSLYSFGDLNGVLQEKFPEWYEIGQLQGDMKLDFYAVKVGDVNGTAATKGFGGYQQRGGPVLEVEVEDVELGAGEEREVALKLKNGSAYSGLQFTLEWSGSPLEVTAVEGNRELGFREDHYRKMPGRMSVSWNGETQDGEVLLSLRVQAQKRMRLSEGLRLSSSITPAVSIGVDGQEGQMALRYSGQIERELVVVPNEPNPWSRQTVIGYLLPQDGEVKISVYDAHGKVHRMDRRQELKGYHELVIGRAELGAAGVYYYQIDFKDKTHTGKMAVVD